MASFEKTVLAKYEVVELNYWKVTGMDRVPMTEARTLVVTLTTCELWFDQFEISLAGAITEEIIQNESFEIRIPKKGPEDGESLWSKIIKLTFPYMSGVDDDWRRSIELIGKLAKLIKDDKRLKQMIPLKWQDFKQVKMLGVGGNGQVFKAKDKRAAIGSSRSMVAIKVPCEKRIDGVLDALNLFQVVFFLLELAYLFKHSRSPHMVRIKGYYWQPREYSGAVGGAPCIVMELAPYGSLRQLLGNTSLPLPLRFRYALDVALGMENLHKNNTMHRDLKSDNILIFSKNPMAGKVCAKKGDAGSMSDLALTNFTRIGTQGFISPEMENNEPYALETDRFSFGKVLEELFFEEPFCAELPPATAEHLRTVRNLCGSRDPQSRPKFSEIFRELAQTPGVERLPQIVKIAKYAMSRGEIMRRSEECNYEISQKKSSRRASLVSQRKKESGRESSLAEKRKARGSALHPRES